MYDICLCLRLLSQRSQLEDVDACLQNSVLEFIYASQHKKQKAAAQLDVKGAYSTMQQQEMMVRLGRARTGPAVSAAQPHDDIRVGYFQPVLLHLITARPLINIIPTINIITPLHHWLIFLPPLYHLFIIYHLSIFLHSYTNY